jgi:hypothetical protein
MVLDADMERCSPSTFQESVNCGTDGELLKLINVQR